MQAVKLRSLLPQNDIDVNIFLNRKQILIKAKMQLDLMHAQLSN